LAVAIVACRAAAPAAPIAAVATPQIVYVTPAPAQAAAPSASPTAAPTQAAPASQDELRLIAGKAYLAVVKVSNKASDRLWKLYRYNTALKPSRTYCAKLGAVTRTELLGLNGIKYPDDTAADAKALVRSLAAMEADLRTCAKASSVAAWNQAWKLFGRAGDRGHEQANVVRLDLGLPPVPG
jgi:hypothetical protein